MSSRDFTTETALLGRLNNGNFFFFMMQLRYKKKQQNKMQESTFTTEKHRLSASFLTKLVHRFPEELNKASSWFEKHLNRHQSYS